uniref:5-methyltetrahydropteroyltriglutamate--homocysteine methyltransferase-like n=1 Tax=Tanacetum cinerariifolium TaxID=118510 RepID=A0A6L2L2P9_TANCI|nr:5-methyltetrahydropteroyltriglutamate--homocysteine methyltransferase-like [Tanacetum cinerariifolium]
MVEYFEKAMTIALAIKDEVEDLEKARIRVIQIGEAALREGLLHKKAEHAFYIDWIVHSFRITNLRSQSSTVVMDSMFGIRSPLSDVFYVFARFRPHSRDFVGFRALRRLTCVYASFRAFTPGFERRDCAHHQRVRDCLIIFFDFDQGGEVDEQMVDLEFDEEEMDDDDDEVEWLMALVTPPRATATVSSTYEVGGPSTATTEGPSFSLPAPGFPVPSVVIEDLSTRLSNLEYRHGVLTRKMEEMGDTEVADSIAIGEIHPRVATIREQA